jgi:hypothetical protein
MTLKTAAAHATTDQHAPGVRGIKANPKLPYVLLQRAEDRALVEKAIRHCLADGRVFTAEESGLTARLLARLAARRASSIAEC